METPKKVKTVSRRKKTKIDKNKLRREEETLKFVLAPSEKPKWDEIIRRCKKNKFTADQVLTLFDLEKEFGPCVGLTRLQRYNRARKLNLGCPAYLLGLIEENSSKMSVVEEYLPET